MSNQSPSNDLDLALLGFCREEPLHGYELHRRLSDAAGMGFVWRVKQSQLYARLGALEDAGLLAGDLEPQDARPPRRVYHLTDRGRAAFHHWLIQPVPRPHEIRLGFMQKLYFVRDAGPDVLNSLVVAQMRICDEWLERQGDMAGQSEFTARVRAYRRGQLSMTIVWLESLLHPLEE